MRCYLSPGNRRTIQDVVVVMAQNPRGRELIVAGDLNVDLGKEGDRGRDKEITTAMGTARLKDLVGHFFPRIWAWCQDWWTWEKCGRGG